MSSAILTGYFPTLVPPNFCTSHLADGSIVFWCRLGGVRGGEEDKDDEDDGGVDLSDILEERQEMPFRWNLEFRDLSSH